MPDCTLLGRRWPEGDASPALLFHKGQWYDQFEQKTVRDRNGRTQTLEAFATERSRLPFLEAIARRVQEVNRTRYPKWYRRFAAAYDCLGAERPLAVATWWRLVAGWATNPTFEVGLTLDPLLGFPFVPGSSVKGLLHRMAEIELLEEPGALPRPHSTSLPESPPADLLEGLRRALRIRALFGSLAARREDPGTDQPEAPYDRLGEWLALLEPERDPDGEPPPAWREAVFDLDLLTDERATGGMVSCFDAVPASGAFAAGADLLEPDVLTPHEGEGPIPITFLAVRAEAPFEVRYRLAHLPPAEGDPRDDEEAFRRRALAEATREELLEGIERWLLRGLAEHGLGGKTSAGYGYLLPPGPRPAPPPQGRPAEGTAKPEEELPPGERYARSLLPDDLDPAHLANALDKAVEEGTEEQIRAVGRRFAASFPGRLADWRKRASNKKSIRDRLEALGLDREDEPGREDA